MTTGDAATRRRGAVLLVPAAGIGSRLGSSAPKVLTPVAGRPMADYLFDLYAAVVDRFVFIVRPGVGDVLIERGRARGLVVQCEVQASPTGMLDAILVPLARIREARPDWVWITWCDQVAVLPETVTALDRLVREARDLRLALPTCAQTEPYIHFERDGEGRIVGVAQRREGDAMPAVGESDSGLFVLALETYAERLPHFAASAARGRASGERNFLPFVPWLSAQHPRSVRTIDCRERIESIGINTPEDLRLVEAHLAARATPAPPR